MRAEYIFYVTDESFSYGDFPGSTIYETERHGFEVDIDSDNNIDISSIEFLGYYQDIKINSLYDLLAFVETHLVEVEEINENSTYSNYEIFEELIELIKTNIKEIQERKAA